VRDEDLTAAIQEVRDRVRARYPEGPLGVNGIAAPDLMPVVHARDAAEAKVAAIGTVNPRPPGLKNSIIQFVKRTIARSLDWHVREQVEFNHAVMRCVQTTIDAMAETNRALAGIAAHIEQTRREENALRREEAAMFQREAQELKDIRLHWPAWRADFEERRNKNEIHMLRTISELQAAFHHRVTLIQESFKQSEQSFWVLAKHQHSEFAETFRRGMEETQAELRADVQKLRGEYEQMLYAEVKLIRQRLGAPVASAAPSAAAPLPTAPIAIDWLGFAHRFRGSEEKIREHQKMYLAKFAGAEEILDLGCGRGEFLEAGRDAGLNVRGIDLSAESVAICKTKGLNAERADLFTYLNAVPDGTLAGVYCSQVVEHLPPERLPDLINLLGRKIKRGALVAFETPNPECLAIFATHFYIDPTHTRPVPAPLLRFYLEEAGFINVEIEKLSPAVETMPSLAELPANVREAFFGGLDYAIFARRS
jgi:2-polyprenyl-3-methyl-5-hydroxy-6-metoxy-1,4-benzoquinol methylase